MLKSNANARTKPKPAPAAGAFTNQYNGSRAMTATTRRPAAKSDDNSSRQRAILRYCRPGARERALKILEPGLPALLASISSANIMPGAER